MKIKDEIFHINALLEDYGFKPFLNEDAYYTHVNGKRVIITGHEIRKLDYEREKIVELITRKISSTNPAS